MQIDLITTGKTRNKYLIDGINIYKQRIKHYIQFEIIEIADLKVKMHKTDMLKILEGEKILKYVQNYDRIILLDEKGKDYTSIAFSSYLQKIMNKGLKKIAFVIGGAYGFSDAVYKNCDEIISLSKMTFSHQMVRLLFLEQLYRSFTIINNEPYHNS